MDEKRGRDEDEETQADRKGMRPTETEDADVKMDAGGGSLASRAAQSGGQMIGSGLVKALMKVDVIEVYSPPWVTAEAATMSLEAGEAIDIIT